MQDNDPRLPVLRRNAALVIERLGPGSNLDPFGFDAASVAWIDGFIERARGTIGDKTEGAVSVLGSYLGEALVRATGGKWHDEPDDGVCVRFPNGHLAFPFRNVSKQLAQGRDNGESISNFYDVCIEYVATGKLDATKT